MTSEQDNIKLYSRLPEAMNSRNYDELDNIFDASFFDHHPGWDLPSLADYKKALVAVHSALDMMVSLDFVFAADDKVVTKVTLTGTHKDAFLGIPPTGNHVSWTSLEIFRVENGKFVERWAQDDLASLIRQLGVPLPSST